jgi:hypothetical protein
MGAYTRILRRAEWGATINLRCKNPNSPMSEVGHFRPSSAGFACRPLPLRPKSGHSASARVYEYTP